MENNKLINIFIIEDDVIYSAALQQFLESGLKNYDGSVFSIQTFKTSESCIDALNNDSKLIPHIIILDYYLNSEFFDAMNGNHALYHLKVFRPDVEVIFLTSQKEVKATAESFRLGAYDYIPKNKFAFPNALYAIKACLQEIETKNFKNNSV